MTKLTITLEVDDDKIDVWELNDEIHEFFSRKRAVTSVKIDENCGGETNVEFFARVSETAPRGGVSTQCFALDAIGKHADRVAATPDEDLAALFAENAFISWQAWKAAALDWVEAFKLRSQR